jgi:hypothetical protein
MYYVPVKLFRELTIIGLDPKTITPPNIIKNINEATPYRKGAIAAKVLLKSGDIIIIFKEEE